MIKKYFHKYLIYKPLKAKSKNILIFRFTMQPLKKSLVF